MIKLGAGGRGRWDTLGLPIGDDGNAGSWTAGKGATVRDG